MESGKTLFGGGGFYTVVRARGVWRELGGGGGGVQVPFYEEGEGRGNLWSFDQGRACTD